MNSLLKGETIKSDSLESLNSYIFKHVYVHIPFHAPQLNSTNP
jgi:hypothetical protein